MENETPSAGTACNAQDCPRKRCPLKPKATRKRAIVWHSLHLLITERCKMTYAEFGVQLGVEERTVDAWVRNYIQPQAARLERIADALHLRASEIVDTDLSREEIKAHLLSDKPAYSRRALRLVERKQEGRGTGAEKALLKNTTNECKFNLKM